MSRFDKENGAEGIQLEPLGEGIGGVEKVKNGPKPKLLWQNRSSFHYIEMLPNHLL